MITQAYITSIASLPLAYKFPAETRGATEYPVDAWDLLQFGACPARWVNTPRQEHEPKVSLSEVVRLLHLTPEHVGPHYVMRPETYEAMRNECPKCQSVSAAKVCRTCNLARRMVTATKPWSAAASYCIQWTEGHTKQLHRIVPYDLAQTAQELTRALDNDEAVAALRAASELQAALRAQWEDEDTGLKIPLRAVINYLPTQGDSHDYGVGSLSVVRDVSPAAWSAAAYTRGHHVAAAFKQDIAAALCGEARPHHLWVVVEPDPPYIVGRRRTTPEMLTAGRTAYQELLKAYARCLSTGIWPVFDTSVPGPVRAWTEWFLEPWMTQGDGKTDRFFGVAASRALEPPQPLAKAA